MYKNFPKIELHLHLDGSVNISLAETLLNKTNLESKMKVSSTCKDLNEYLEKFTIPSEIMQTKENIEKITYKLLEDLYEDNIIYAEIRFAPIKHTLNNSLEEVIEIVKNTLNNYKKIKTTLILCMMRDSTFEENKKIIDLAHIYNLPIDLAGAEALYKTENFKDLFMYANKLGVKYTIHAGEADGIESIKSAVSFGTKRIGHGVRIIDDIDNIDFVKNITFEVCPKSNIDTKAFLEYENHPIRKMYDKGLLVTISTDNNTVSNITLTEEYERLVKTFNFKEEDFFKMNMNAINAAFITETEKEELKKVYVEKYNIWKGEVIK